MWQHCLDEGTQHYYFWNTVTNQVTWEIPAEYSQYLVRFKEYEEDFEKYETRKKEQSDKKSDPDIDGYPMHG